MAEARIQAVISAQDNASAVVKNFAHGVEQNSGRLASFSANLQKGMLAFTAVAGSAGLLLDRFTQTIEQSLTAANRQQAALTGLTSVAKAFGASVDEATRAAKSLAGDGLMSVGEAAQGLKNLLAAGFSLPQATKLMERFKDSAAFGRQSALTFGQAVTSATEGIKNGNSILVDNAGVTKNLSVILEEAGFSAQDLMKATTDANIRMALFNGIIRETNPQLGDASRLTELFAGGQAKLSTQVEILRARIGEALQPVLLKLLEVITPLVEKLATWIEQHPRLTTAIIIAAGLFLSLVAVIGGLLVAVGALVALFGSGVAAIVGIVAGVAAAISIAAGIIIANFDKIKVAVRETIDWFRRLKDSADNAVSGAISKIPGIGRIGAGRAIGGPVQPGIAYPVGEMGPELFIPSQPGKIVPNSQLAQFQSGGHTIININANIGLYAGTELEKRKVASELFRALKDVAMSQNLNITDFLSGGRA